MVFIQSWDETTPPGGEALANGDNRIRAMKEALRERLAVDHQFLASEAADTHIGQHNKVTLIDQVTDAAAAAGATVFYAKTVSGVIELFGILADGTIAQLTVGGKLNAAALGITGATRGDLLARGASAFGRVAIGAAQRLLRSDGTDPSWAQILNLANLDQLHGANLKTNGGNNTALSVTDPTAARTITVPDRSLILSGLEIKTGTYTGNGTNGRNITIGFADTNIVPKFVLVQANNNGLGPFYKTEAMPGANSLAIYAASSFTTVQILALSANTFQISDQGEVNQSAQDYYWVAIG